MLIWNSELVPKMFYLVMLEKWELSVDKRESICCTTNRPFKSG